MRTPPRCSSYQSPSQTLWAFYDDNLNDGGARLVRCGPKMSATAFGRRLWPVARAAGASFREDAAFAAGDRLKPAPYGPSTNRLVVLKGHITERFHGCSGTP